MRSSRRVRTLTGAKSDEAPDEIARETRMVKPKSYEERLLMTASLRTQKTNLFKCIELVRCYKESPNNTAI